MDGWIFFCACSRRIRVAYASSSAYLVKVVDAPGLKTGGPGGVEIALRTECVIFMYLFIHLVYRRRTCLCIHRRRRLRLCFS